MASKGVNKVIIVGRLGQDPEVRYSPSGSCFANLSVATSEQWRDKQTGEQKELTEWHRVVISGKLAEIAGEYLRKGSEVYLEGKLQTRKWQDQSGADRYTTEIRVGVGGTMQMLGGRQDNSGAPAGNQQSGRNQPPTNRQSSGGNRAQTNAPPAASEPPMDFDDDIPFAPIGLQHPTHFIYSI